MLFTCQREDHLPLLILPCTTFAAGAAAFASLGGLATDSLSLGLACLSLLLGSAMNYLLIWHRIERYKMLRSCQVQIKLN